jgi:hypothetical protein
LIVLRSMQIVSARMRRVDGAAALDRGGVEQQQRVVAAGALRGEHAD